MRLANKIFYTVITISRERIAVCKFRRRSGSRFALTAHAEAKCNSQDDQPLRQVLKEVGGASGFIVLTGSLQDGEFFRAPGQTTFSVREQRDALEFELPRRMLKTPADPYIQFYPVRKDSGTDCELNVYVFPQTGLYHVADLLNHGKTKADEFIYPLLGIKPEDPDLYLPSLDPDFVFRHGEWEPAGEADRILSPEWKSELDRKFILPADFDPLPWMESLMVIRQIAAPEFRSQEKSVRILPAKLRPRRLRLHVTLTIILILMLAGIQLYQVAGDRLARYHEFSELVQERNLYLKKNQNLQSQLKKMEKEQKERSRIMALSAGNSSMVDCLYELTQALPPTVLVSSFRYTDPNLDLMLQTDTQNLNLAQNLKGLKNWKVASLNERSMNTGLTMIFLKLSPVSAEEPKTASQKIPKTSSVSRQQGGRK